MHRVTNVRLSAVLAWSALLLIGYGTLTRAKFVYSIYDVLKPLLFGAAPATWAHVEHAIAFLTLGLLFALAYPKRFGMVCAIVVAAAIGFEYLQTFTPDRHGTLIDAAEKVVAGCLGVAIVGLGRFVRCDRRGTSPAPPV